MPQDMCDILRAEKVDPKLQENSDPARRTVLEALKYLLEQCETWWQEWRTAKARGHTR